MKLYGILFTSLALCIAALSCKKEETSSSSYKTMSGSFELDELPSFVAPGDVFEFEGKGVSIPDDETDKTIEVIYTFSTSASDITDTTALYRLVIPDVVGDFTVTAKASAKGYYTKTVTLNTTVVSEKSISGADKSSLSVFTDGRDGRKYHSTPAGPAVWMADNLAYYEKDADGAYTLGRPYGDAKASEDVFGAFYVWEDARKACPEGWHIPTVAEWEKLGTDAGSMMCDAYYNGTRLWEFWPDVKITNSLALFALPFGYATVVDGKYDFRGFNDYAFFWADNGGDPRCYHIISGVAEIKTYGSPSGFAAQLRCVK